MVRIEAKENKIYLDDGKVLEYDVLSLNIGSRTKDANNVKGVNEFALTTRPINYMLDKIIKKERELKDKNIIPTVVMCGAGAAGTELSFAFKTRWSSYFGTDIKVTLLASKDEPLHTEVE